MRYFFKMSKGVSRFRPPDTYGIGPCRISGSTSFDMAQDKSLTITVLILSKDNGVYEVLKTFFVHWVSQRVLPALDKFLVIFYFV